MDGNPYPAVPTAVIDTADTMAGLVFEHLRAGRGTELAMAPASALMPFRAGEAPRGIGGHAASGFSISADAQAASLGTAGGWVQALGGNDTLAGDGNAPGFTAQPYGALLGYDRTAGPGLRIGYLLGAWHTGLSLNDGSGANAGINSILAGAYAGYVSGPWEASVIAAYTFDSVQATRPITFTGVSRTATSSYTGNDALAAFEIGYRTALGTVTLVPTLGVEYVHAAQGTFTETGAQDLGLSVGGQGTDSLRGLLGVRLGGGSPGSAEGARRLAWGAYAGYSHEFVGTARQVTAAVVGASTLPFTVVGVTPAADAVTAGVRFTWSIRDQMDVFIGYDVLWSGNQTGTIGAQFRL